MIKYDTAETILISSIESLMDQNSELTKGDLLNEIRNVICLYILKSQRKEGAKATSIEGMSQNMVEDFQENNYIETTEIFSKAALTIFPQYYKDKDSLMMTFNVKESLSDTDQWELLKKYFFKFHNLNIDDLL